MTATDRAAVDADRDAMAPGHVGVSEVIRGVGIAVRRAFPSSVWVKGEVSDYRPMNQGHHYFSLVERLADGSQMVLPCAIWKSNWPQIRTKLINAGITLTSGQEMLFQGTVRLYDGAGKLTFHVSDVYPEFTLGQIEAQRRAVLTRLKRENLIGLNRRQEIPAVPLRVAVLSSRSAAGLRDFEEVLSRSGYAFSVLRCEIPVQGPMVERAVCRALEVLTLKQEELKLDVVCIVRGGGSATDLGWWNSYAICAAVAIMRVPVITGIGHDRDRVAADEVAHSAAPTPTAAAEILCSLVRTSDSELREATGQIVALTMQRLADTSRIVRTIEQAIAQTASASVGREHAKFRSLREHCTAHARRSLAPHNNALFCFQESMRRNTGRAIRQESANVLEAGNALAKAAKKQARRIEDGLAYTTEEVTALSNEKLTVLAEHHAALMVEAASISIREIAQSRKLLGNLGDLVQAYDPVHILRRGFSITLNEQGKAVKTTADLLPGETIITRLAAGHVASTVTKTN